MLLLIPGPVQTDPRVRAAMAQDIAPWDNDFRAIVRAVRERVLALAGGIPGVHTALPLQGSGHFVLEAAIRAYTAPGARVLVPQNGAYAERAIRLAREAGREVVVLPLPDTRGARAEDIAPALAADPTIAEVVLVHSETGSGVVNDAVGIGAIVRAAGRGMILDAVSAFGALPFPLVDHPECDAVVFTSGKCLEGMPGLGFAVARRDRMRPPGAAGSWCLDLPHVAAHAEEANGAFRFTPPAQVLAAFAVALELHDAEGGIAARGARYAENASVLFEGLRDLGLRPYLERAEQGPIIVTVHQPADPAFTLQGFVDALKARGVLISNFDNTPEPSFRVGAIGAVTPAAMRGAVAAMDAALFAMGVRQRA